MYKNDCSIAEVFIVLKTLLNSRAKKKQHKKEIEQKSSCTQAMKSTEEVRCNLAPPTPLLLLENCFLTLSSHLNIARCMSFILFYFIFIFFPS